MEETAITKDPLQAENISAVNEWNKPNVEDSRSEEFTEIIGKMPHWIIRRGITIISLLCICILAGAYFFKYPDIVRAKVTVVSENPPVKLVARNSLPIQHIFVGNDEIVKKGQILCFFSNAANYNDILALNGIIEALDTSFNLAATIAAISIPNSLQLGEMQANYIELYQTIQSFKFFANHNAYEAAIGNLSAQMAYSNQLQAEQYARQVLQNEQLSIQQRQFAADSTLLGSKVISRLEYEESKKKMLNQKISSSVDKASILQNKLQQSEYAKDIAITSLQRQNDENDLLQKVKDALHRFRGALAQWEQNYVLRSPIDGKVSFFNVWKENQFIEAGQGIMMIIPPVHSILVRGTTGTDRYGEIKAGQKVLLKLEAYPHEEFGMLEGVLIRKTSVPMDNNYAIEIKLKQGLKTNSGKLIPTNPSLQADAEIVTDDKSVLQRLFNKILGKIK